jgi:preprotein translocase subunit SecD
MTRPDDTAGWREVADRLTPEQAARFEIQQRSGDDPAAMRAMADELAAANATAAMSGQIAAPPDATRLYGWQSHGERTWREFDGSTRQVGSAVVRVRGQQFADGGCERWISVSATHDEEFQAEQARELAAALQAAADEADRLA